MNERTERLEKDFRERWFPNHEANDHNMDGVLSEYEELIWKEPGTTTYYIHYVRRDGTLYVSGDCGSAVYRWSDVAPLEWIAGLDYSYFAGKCEASYNGVPFNDWDGDKAGAELHAVIAECDDEDRQAVIAEHREDIEIATTDRAEWHAFLADYGDECFGSDAWELGGIGEVIASRCMAHLYGLKMAFGLVNADANTEVAQNKESS